MTIRPIEQTLFFFKPDSLKHSLTGQVLTRISDSFNTIAEERGSRIGIVYSAQKTVSPTRSLLEVHYPHLSGRILQSTIDYVLGLDHYTEEWATEREISSEELPRYRRLSVYAIAGGGITQIVRDILGPTDPDEAKAEAENSVRAQHGINRKITDPNDKDRVLYSVFYNIAHASEEGEQERELRLWFKPGEFSHKCYREQLDYVFCEKHYYLTKDGLVRSKHELGSLCIAAPSDMVWRLDILILEDHLQNGKNAKSDLRIAVEKYRVNLDHNETCR